MNTYTYFFNLWLKRIRKRDDVKKYIRTYGHAPEVLPDAIAYAALLALAED